MFIGGNRLSEAVEPAVVFVMRLVDRKEGVTQQSQRADQVGVATPCVVFSEAGVLAPVKAVLDSGPVVTNELQPLFEAMSVGGTTADVVADFFERLALPGAPVTNTQGTAGMREIDFQGFDGDAAHAPRFAATVSFGMDVGKRGVAAVR